MVNPSLVLYSLFPAMCVGTAGKVCFISSLSEDKINKEERKQKKKVKGKEAQREKKNSPIVIHFQ